MNFTDGTPTSLYVASGNAHKVAELQALAVRDGLPLQLRSAREAGGMPDVVEDTGTFEGNAAKKARALHVRLPAGSGALADDSGLCVDELGGAPGVESAYYAGAAGDPVANLRKLIEVLRGVPAERRGAHFRCVLVLIAPDGAEHVFSGRCDGTLRADPAGGHGFGYDPLFVPAEAEQTFAELPEDQKNRLSHRSLAWARLAEWWRERPTG
jgi:XTP/dITP diphosphohydrolase